MRPLARWTIGPVSKSGMDVLRESVFRFEEVYPEFETIVCYNNIDEVKIGSCKAGLYKQSTNEVDYPLTSFDDPLLDVEEPLRRAGMAGSGWKLSPPRLRLEAHELWMDNDIVISSRLPEIDDWLNQSDAGIISEGRHRIFGVYEDLVPSHLRICAGFFGVPPNFDLHQSVVDLCNLRLKGKSLGHYDEQGLVAAIVTNMDNFIVVSQEHLTIVEDREHLPDEFMGIHFVGVNRSNEHSGWSEFKNRVLKVI